MNTTTSARPIIPDNFTALEKSLVEKSEQAIVKGRELEHWSRDPRRRIRQFPLSLNRPYALPNRAWGYFADVCIEGRTLAALGCQQQVEFGRITGPNPEERLLEYVLGRFLSTSAWMYPDGNAGGFTIQQMLYCDAERRCGRYPADQLTVARDWREIGTKYQWSLLTIFLHDFVIHLGPMKTILKEAVAVVQHPDFVHIVPGPKPGYKLEVAIGYPFIDYAPVPNYFGFGPGKFDWAVKTYSFLLRDNNEVRCDMEFVAGARAKKVFDFGSYIPCPLYGTSDLMEFLTLGVYKSQPFRDYMDLQMAVEHAHVHQALMEGSSKIFAAWEKTASLEPAMAGV
ncbi:MAG TPA: hypothetical protein VK886_19525 [Vicinamibacterales bacterium]|nr:hypothetical protein [Vicinamibacterales bacterium]